MTARPRRGAGLPWALAFLLLAAVMWSGERADPYRSVAQLTGWKCGRNLLASATVAAPGLLVTSAHNVAGSEGGLSIRFEDGAERPAEVAAMDFDRDLALLSSSGWNRPALGFAPHQPGETGRIIRLRAQAERAEILFTDAELVRAVGRDIYNQRNDVPWLNVRVRVDSGGVGYSGAPALNERGSVIGLVYAKARHEDHMYSAAASEVEAFLARAAARPSGAPADTGECPP